jgi:chromosome segregation ATPase
MSLVDDFNQWRDGLAFLRGFLELLKNPEATGALLDQLEQATAKADEERAAVKELKREQEQIRAQMADEAEAHRRQLSDERLALNNEINRRYNEVSRAEAAVAQAKTEQEEAARQAGELRARWQKKIDAVDAGLRA